MICHKDRIYIAPKIHIKHLYKGKQKYARLQENSDNHIVKVIFKYLVWAIMERIF